MRTIRLNIRVWIVILNLPSFGLKSSGDGGKRFISKALRVAVWVVTCKNHVTSTRVMTQTRSVAGAYIKGSWLGS